MDPEALLLAAEGLIAAEGLDATSIRAIAKRAGCDPALIYYHFDSKVALFSALLTRRLDPLEQELARLSRPDGRPLPVRLWEVLGVYRSRFQTDGGFRSLMRNEMLRGAEETRTLIGESVRRNAQHLWSIFEQGLASGEIRPGQDPRLLGFFFARFYMELLEMMPVFCARVARLENDPQALPMAERAWFDLFWRGVGTDPEAGARHLATLEAL